jgi:hypothetical protein
MDQRFDPYHAWLSIPAKDQPPHHYRLLGLDLLEADPEVIQRAADRQRAYLRQHQNGPRARESQQLLNEVSQAALCLLDPQLKRSYDAELKTKLAKISSPPELPKRPLPVAAVLPVAASPRPAAVPVSPDKPIATVHTRPAVAKRRQNQTLVMGIGAAAAAVLLLGVVVVLATSGNRPPSSSPKPTPQIAALAEKQKLSREVQDLERTRASSASDQDEPPESESEAPEIAGEKPESPVTSGDTSNATPPETPPPEPPSLSSLVDQSAAGAAKDQDRQLWASANAVFERWPDGSWRGTLVNGRRITLRELSRSKAFVELQNSTGKTRLLLYDDHVERLPPPPNEQEKDGSWFTPLALLPLGDSQADIDRAIKNYDADLTKARSDLDRAFQSALTAVRRRSGKPEERLAAVKILEADQARFSRNGLVSWALPMRDDSRDYVVALNKAARQANEAFDRVIDKLVASGDDQAAASLAVIKRKTIAPHVIAALEAPGHFTNRLLSNGHVNEANSRWTWSIDKAGLFATGPHEGEIYVDRYTLSEDGAKFRLKNNKNAQLNGIVLSEPFEP